MRFKGISFIQIIEKIFSKEVIKVYIMIIFVLIIRYFVLEPFRIPSGSMNPTILVGDFIFVNKFIYGFKIPIINKKININIPERGDIIVFKKSNNINYIKRLVGLEYDEILYKHKSLYINNIKIKTKYKYEEVNFNKNNIMLEITHIKEYLNPKKEYYVQIYKNIKDSKYNFSKIKLPKDTYFVLGDNRDNSEDSRFWGTVHKEKIIGKAFLIWMSIDKDIIDIRWNRLIKNIK